MLLVLIWDTRKLKCKFTIAYKFSCRIFLCTIERKNGAKKQKIADIGLESFDSLLESPLTGKHANNVVTAAPGLSRISTQITLQWQSSL